MTGRTIEKVEKAKSEIESAGIKGKLVPLRLDVTDEASIKRAVTFVDQTYGRLDALINNVHFIPHLLSSCLHFLGGGWQHGWKRQSTLPGNLRYQCHWTGGGRCCFQAPAPQIRETILHLRDKRSGILFDVGRAWVSSVHRTAK